MNKVRSPERAESDIQWQFRIEKIESLETETNINIDTNRVNYSKISDSKKKIDESPKLKTIRGIYDQ